MQQMPELETLVLISRQLNGDGLRYVSECKKLRSLQLHFPIGNGPLKHLQSLPALEHLSLYLSNVDDDGLSQVAKMTNLRELYLNGLDISNEGIAQLLPLGKLTVLSITECPRITDEVMPHLEQFERLEHLGLAPYITDDSILALSRISTLQSLHLPNSAITPKGRAELKSLRPKLFFTR
ncbi:hypothetical protein [Anatilimnocola floriformis]|uniref:hypothetical protein n=1 Tax=Anatilimnocola floriformis TaxID=2948575 RepID=UPI0020C1FACB|nr:hypothetical protein [Anatilimnocola floriformis]